MPGNCEHCERSQYRRANPCKSFTKECNQQTQSQSNAALMRFAWCKCDTVPAERESGEQTQFGHGLVGVEQQTQATQEHQHRAVGLRATVKFACRVAKEKPSAQYCKRAG